MRIGATASWIIATVFGAALSAPQAARAADIPARLPTKAPAAVVAPVSSWTGFYVSGGIGYGLWTAETRTTDPAPLLDALPLVQTHGGNGWLGRVGGGFDYQFNERIVAGLFADFDFSSIKGTISDPRVSLSADIKQTRSWSVGGRAGWLINPSLLSYFTAGYAEARFSSGTMVPFTDTSAFSGYTTPAFSRGGWFLGGGAETALGGGWFGRTEYRYAYYGDQVLSDTSATPPAPFFGAIQNIHFKPTVQTITMQLVYKLDTGAPAPGRTPVTVGRANFNGAYVNAGGGYGMWVADETTTAIPGSANPAVRVTQRLGGKGWLGRAGGGYDHRFSERILAGVFGDVDISSLKGSIQDAAAGLEGKTRETWAWAAGARAGLLIASDTLAYVNAGYTQAHFSSATMHSMLTTAPFFGLSTPSFTADGWFVGGGVEASLGSGWFWRNEYRRANYGSETVTDTSANPAALIRNNINFKPMVQTVTTQLMYKFNSSR